MADEKITTSGAEALTLLRETNTHYEEATLPQRPMDWMDFCFALVHARGLPYTTDPSAHVDVPQLIRVLEMMTGRGIVDGRDADGWRGLAPTLNGLRPGRLAYATPELVKEWERALRTAEEDERHRLAVRPAQEQLSREHPDRYEELLAHYRLDPGDPRRTPAHQEGHEHVYRLTALPPDGRRETRYYLMPQEAQGWRDRLRETGYEAVAARAPAAAFLPLDDAQLDTLARKAQADIDAQAAEAVRRTTPTT